MQGERGGKDCERVNAIGNVHACACMLVCAYVKEREEEKERDLGNGSEEKRRQDVEGREEGGGW